MVVPKAFSRFSGAGGFTAAWRARLRFVVPTLPLRVGERTWICSGGMPMLWGRRVWQRETMVSTAAVGSSRRRKKKSPAASFFSTGQAPWSTARAPRMMAEAAACRKISVRRTVGRQWERSRSDRTFPGPTEGS